MIDNILTAMAIAGYENDLTEYGEKGVLDPDVHALSWGDLSEDEQAQRKRSLAAALRKAAGIAQIQRDRDHAEFSQDWRAIITFLEKIAEQAHD